MLQKHNLHFEFIHDLLLCRIDHWDNEREKLVILCERSLLIISYDFIVLAVKSTRRIMLNQIQKVKLGELVYPKKSLMK